MPTHYYLHHRPLLGVAVAMLAACSGGASSDNADGTVSGGYSLASGTRIEAAMIETLSSRNGTVGDRFSAEVVRDVQDVDGRVLIPAGSLLHGSITEVGSAPNPGAPGTLTLAVSDVTVGGTVVPLEASIDSLVTLREGRPINEADVARVAGGAVAGAVLGRVIGGNAKGTVIGGVIGAGAGVIVSAEIKDTDIVLPAGSRLMLTLRHQLALAGDRP